MTRPNLLVLAFVAGMAAWPVAAAASGGVVATVTATGVQATDGRLDGSLAALEEVSTGTTLHLGLSAEWVDAVLEAESGPMVANQTPTDQAAPPEQRSYRDVTGGTGLLRPGHQAYVLPLPGEAPPRIAASGPCLAVVPAGRAEVEVPMYVETAAPRHNETRAVNDTLAWDSSRCGGPGWVVEGAFLLTLWEADLEFAHASGNASYATGQVAPSDPLRVGNHVDRQLFLTVRGGRLDLRGANPSVYFSGADLDAAHLGIDGATGVVAGLAGNGRAEGERLDLEGSFIATVVGAAGSVRVTVTGDLEAASLGGRSIVVASPAGSGGTAWVALLVLAPVAAAGGAAVARRRPAKALALLDRMALTGRHEAVARRARRMQKVDGLGHEATALRVQALANLGRYEQAIAEARLLPPMESSMAAAYTHALAGDVAACAASLRACAALDADWVRVALREPVFAVASRHPSLASLRGAMEGIA